MQESNSFAVELGRLRSGDESAVFDFVAAYEPYLRRAVRLRLRRIPIRAITDSEEICLSALGSFLVRIRRGEFDLSQREDLSRLLSTIVRRKVATVTRRELAACRDRRRTTSGEAFDVAADEDDGPSRLASRNDLLDCVERCLSDAERRLFRLRRIGESWNAIAEAAGEPAEVLRQRLSRALRRVAMQLAAERSGGW